MSAQDHQQPRRDADVDIPGTDYVPHYTPPAWYQQRPQDAEPPIPWHSVAPQSVEPGCHVCGARPVAHAEVRAHTGLLFFGWSRSVGEPLCRQCGISLVRTMTTHTLWRGWWGLLSLLFHTPVALAENAAAYRKYRALPPPTPVPGRRPLHLGKPVLRRPQAYVALVPLAWAIVLISSIALR